MLDPSRRTSTNMRGEPENLAIHVPHVRAGNAVEQFLELAVLAVADAERCGMGSTADVDIAVFHESFSLLMAASMAPVSFNDIYIQAIADFRGVAKLSARRKNISFCAAHRLGRCAAFLVGPYTKT